MNNQNDTNLEAVLKSIEEKLQTLEDNRSELQNQIRVKRAQIDGMTQAIKLLHEMDAN
ncbi:hypothetical protein [Bradymonas sediminis]|uniref:hypothetical protein n=1 Tax=Bradymonas sediminis TaxID=1548548 RepID=UPI0010E13C84|nr:hypothetical protein [Bradymonas sediminis]TDP64452.1 hypothetical protein DFR33_109113 [Bradymonas sediminis]